MKFKTARILCNISQNSIEHVCGVFQSRQSKFEKYSINMRPDEQGLIEKYLDVKIDWTARQESEPLTTFEWREIKPIINHFMNKNRQKMIRWVNKLGTDRNMYNDLKKILNSKSTMVHGFRFSDGHGVPRILEMRWDKLGKPTYEHLKDDNDVVE